MYIVYILYSEKDKGLYVGCTSNLDKRLKRHNSGQVIATILRQLLVCIYNETYSVKSEAFNKERYLKTLWSSHFKKKLKNLYLKNKQSE